MKNSFYRIGSNTALCLLVAALAACRPDVKPVSVVNNHSHDHKHDQDHKHRAIPVMSAQEKSAVAGLQWLNGANAAQDAANEISQAAAEGRQPKLMAFAQRGLQYPGVSKEQLAAIQGKVGYQVAEGSGDVTYGNTHRRMRQKLAVYAIAYNQAIVAAIP